MSIPPPSTPPRTIILLGAGITALSTAHSLLTSPLTSHHRIVLLAEHTPGDLSLDYTSPWAGGHWRSHASFSEQDRECREWDARTYGVWRGMCLEAPGNETVQERTRRIGLGIKTCKYFWAHDTAETTSPDGSGLWWKDVVAGFRVLDAEKDEGRPRGTNAVFGVEYESICINVPVYLQFMYERVKALGGRVIKTRFDTSAGLEGVVRDAKKIAVERVEGLKEGDIAAVINCTGLSARHFVGKEEAEKLYPIRGQTVLVKGEAKLARTFVGFGNEEEVSYVIPRPGSGTTILGGTKEVGEWEGEADRGTTARILGVVRREGWLRS